MTLYQQPVGLDKTTYLLSNFHLVITTRWHQSLGWEHVQVCGRKKSGSHDPKWIITMCTRFCDPDSKCKQRYLEKRVFFLDSQNIWTKSEGDSLCTELTSTFPTVDHMSRNQSHFLGLCPEHTEGLHYTVDPLHFGNLQKVSWQERCPHFRGLVGCIQDALKCMPKVTSFQGVWDRGVLLYSGTSLKEHRWNKDTGPSPYFIWMHIILSLKKHTSLIRITILAPRVSVLGRFPCTAIVYTCNGISL